MNKKLTAGNIFSIISMIAGVAGIIIYCINAFGSYYHDFGMQVPTVIAVAIVIELAAFFLTKKNDEKYVYDILYVVSGIVFMVAVIIFLGDRVESAGIILGSDLEAGNALASNSLYQSFAGIGCLIAAMILEGISGFMKQNPEA